MNEERNTEVQLGKHEKTDKNISLTHKKKSVINYIMFVVYCNNLGKNGCIKMSW